MTNIGINEIIFPVTHINNMVIIDYPAIPPIIKNNKFRNMEDELVSFETAKLAKEKGFKEDCKYTVNSQNY